MNTEPVVKEDTNIYSIPRDDIAKLCLKPSVFFNIKDICRLHDARRSPGRGAFLWSEQEDLATVLPHRGNVVSKLDLDQVDNKHLVYRFIEENILKDFIGMSSPSVTLRTGNCVLKQREQYCAKDIRHFFDADERFHALFFSEIFRGCCPFVIEGEYSNCKRIRLLALMVDENFVKDSIGGYESTVKAVSIRNLDKLMFWSSLHTDRYKAQKRWLLKRFPGLFTQSDKESEDMHKSPADLTSDFLSSIRSRGL